MLDYLFSAITNSLILHLTCDGGISKHYISLPALAFIWRPSKIEICPPCFTTSQQMASVPEAVRSRCFRLVTAELLNSELDLYDVNSTVVAILVC